MIKVAVVGAKGNIGSKVVERFDELDDIEVILKLDPEYSGNRREQPDVQRELKRISREGAIIVDFTDAAAVEQNLPRYLAAEVPFVIGTTGWDHLVLEQNLSKLKAPCVVAPNMSPTLVALQAMLEYAANMFPNVFEGFNFIIEESHRSGKKDVSGTAKSWAKSFQAMGAPAPFIYSIREEDRAHGYHTYDLSKGSIGRDAVRVGLSTKIDDQWEYIDGVEKAVRFLDATRECILDTAIEPKDGNRVFSMVDVLMS